MVAGSLSFLANCVVLVAKVLNSTSVDAHKFLKLLVKYQLLRCFSFMVETATSASAEGPKQAFRELLMESTLQKLELILNCVDAATHDI